MRSISDHILDIIENSVRASATLIEIIITENKNVDLYTVEIIDNGCGMTRETAAKAQEPFYTSRTTRKVGLGLPLLKHSAEQSGGFLTVESTPGMGTTVKATFGFTHIDRPPLGDMAGVFLLSVIGHPGIGYKYKHLTDEGSYSISSAELKEALEGVSLNGAEIRKAITALIVHNLGEICASK